MRLPDQYAAALDNDPHIDQKGGSTLETSVNGASNGNVLVSNPTTTKGKSPARDTPNPLSTHLTKWIFGLTLIVDLELSSSEISTLRELARVVMRVAGWRWVEGVMTGEVKEGHVLGQRRKDGLGWIAKHDPSSSAVEISEKQSAGLNGANGVGDPSRSTCAAGEAGGIDGDTTGVQTIDEEDAAVDPTLARCWMIVYAVAAGWGQTDLIEDIVKMFQ